MVGFERRGVRVGMADTVNVTIVMAFGRMDIVFGAVYISGRLHFAMPLVWEIINKIGRVASDSDHSWRPFDWFYSRY